jgi:hypothetical protein
MAKERKINWRELQDFWTTNDVSIKIVAKIGIEPILIISTIVDKINKKLNKNNFFFSF